jgi:hypothetical protein
MVPLYAACIEDLGPDDFVKVDCAACSHTALLAPAFFSPLGLSPRSKVLDRKDRVRCRACGARGRAVVFATDFDTPGSRSRSIGVANLDLAGPSFTWQQTVAD